MKAADRFKRIYIHILFTNTLLNITENNIILLKINLVNEIHAFLLQT